MIKKIAIGKKIAHVFLMFRDCVQSLNDLKARVISTFYFVLSELKLRFYI